jgi:hypothetical protein
LHLARTGPLQGLHLVRRGGAQSGAVRPAQTGLAAPECKPMKNRQIRSLSTARLPILVQVVATIARNAPVAHRAHIVSPVLHRCKNTPLWTRTSLTSADRWPYSSRPRPSAQCAPGATTCPSSARIRIPEPKRFDGIPVRCLKQRARIREEVLPIGVPRRSKHSRQMVRERCHGGCPK